MHAKPEQKHRDPEAKTQHIDVCLNANVDYDKTTLLECFEFDNQALPEISLEDVSTATSLVGGRIAAPLMIAPMTGGNARGHAINRCLARAAERWGLPMGVGSQRLAIENAVRDEFFELRRLAPSVPLFANLGGAQLVTGWGVDEVRRAVDMIRADAVFIHLNPMQEAIQGGDVDWRGLATRLSTLAEHLNADGTPLFVREVCFGMSERTAQLIIDSGVAGIDCSGAGGTSWAKVEAHCAKSERRRILGEVFGEWGIPTARSIMNVRRVSADIPLIACGGIRSGLDIAKCIALGADIGAIARPFLLAADKGDEAVDSFIDWTLMELKTCMFVSGAVDLDELRHCQLRHTGRGIDAPVDELR